MKNLKKINNKIKKINIWFRSADVDELIRDHKLMQNELNYLKKERINLILSGKIDFIKRNDVLDC